MLKVFEAIKSSDCQNCKFLKFVREEAMFYKSYEINTSHLRNLDIIHNKRILEMSKISRGPIFTLKWVGAVNRIVFPDSICGGHILSGS
jgi:hypothetical protein